MNIKTIVDKAATSGFYLWVLNQGLNRMIPYNRPHGLRVTSINENEAETCLAFKRRNQNHIRGMHACALATQTEFTSGLLLVSCLDPAKFRIILKSLEMEYHYQAKTKTFCNFRLSPDRLEKEVLKPLEHVDAVVIVCLVKIYNIDNEHISTGKVHWQVKSWQKVRTNVKESLS